MDEYIFESGCDTSTDDEDEEVGNADPNIPKLQTIVPSLSDVWLLSRATAMSSPPLARSVSSPKVLASYSASLHLAESRSGVHASMCDIESQY